ncbi:MAG: hypothetical protein WBP29_12780 [Candidatus Zixiibacteriota bacterium]
MINRFNAIVIAVLLIANIVFVVQIRALKNEISSKTKQSETLADAKDTRAQVSTDSTDLVFGDLFGVYTYAQFGAWFAPEGADGRRVRSPLTLNVFLSSKTECPALLGEMEVLRRLEPLLAQRGQRMIAVCDADDSLAVDSVLRQERLQIPLMPLVFEDGNTTFADLGISSFSMPFKVIYDSTFSAIYVRGADNTPESQADFERAVLRLSSLVNRGEL